MSSLIQHSGRIHKGKVELFLSLATKNEYGSLVNDVETIPCERCKAKCADYPGLYNHAVLYRIWRKPRGMFGCWVIFAYNGEMNVPDLSIPVAVEKLPRDAKRLADVEILEHWHSD